MAINFGLAQPSGGFDYLETLRALGQNQALQQDMASQAQRQQIQGYAFNRQQEQDAARPQILQQRQSGDSMGAQQRAFAIGDYDALKAIQTLDDNKRTQLGQQMGTLGRLATSLIRLPAEQRQKAYQAVAPMLVKQGFDPAMVQQADLTDGGLQQYIAAAGSTDDVLKNYYKQQEGYTLNEGDRRYVGGEMVAENPAAAKYQAVPEGGMLVRTDGGSATPVLGMGGGGLASGSAGGTSAGRYQYGWTPRARNGGDNSDAAVDSKIAGMSQALGIDPTQTFPPGVTPTQIAQALTLSEGGRGSLADRNNNPGNLRDPRTGDYRKFPTKEAGLAAAAAQVRRNLSRGQNTIQAMVEGVPAGGGRQARGGGDPNVIYGRPKQPNVPSGYEPDGAGGLRPIRGGPADKPGGATGGTSRKDEAQLRKEFEGRGEVKDFRKARTQFNALRETALNPKATAQDDIAVIFQFMKTLDPTSTVREGEFATAQNATGVPDAVRNAFNKAQNGERLNPQQRKQMAQTAYRSYQQFREAYNSAAGEFRSYASDYGVNPDRVARTYTPDKPTRQAQRPAIGVGQSTQVGGFKVTRVK